MLKIKRFLDFVIDILLAILAAAIAMQFIFMRSHVPTGSMIPTIAIGDQFILNRITPYYRAPNRGEILVFYDGTNYLIKRVIGLPGEKIDLINGDVYINNQKLDEPYLNDPHSTYPLIPSLEFPYEVPQDYFFLMGDNRFNSVDSRYFGPISKNDIVAIGGLKFFPFNDIHLLQ